MSYVTCITYFTFLRDDSKLLKKKKKKMRERREPPYSKEIQFVLTAKVALLIIT